MGKDFYENSASAREVFDQAESLLGLDMKKLCFEENDELNITEYTQIALLTACMAMERVVREQGVAPQVTAGLSLANTARSCPQEEWNFPMPCGWSEKEES